MAKLFYKPFGIVAGLITGLLAGKIFDAIWGHFDEEHVPGAKAQATLREASTAKAVSGAALQAATFAGTKALVDRTSLRWFEYFTGAWAGDKPPKVEDPPSA